MTKQSNWIATSAQAGLAMTRHSTGSSATLRMTVDESDFVFVHFRASLWLAFHCLLKALDQPRGVLMGVIVFLDPAPGGGAQGFGQWVIRT